LTARVAIDFDRFMAVSFSRPLGLLCALALLCGCCPTAGAQSFASLNGQRHVASQSRTTALGTTSRNKRAESMPTLPGGRDIATLSFRECRRLLERARVSFEAVPGDAAPAVHEPVYLLSPLSGVSFQAKNGMSEHSMVDCRLAVALLSWAPALRAHGVVKVEHYSTYRPGARVARTSKASGHSRAMAIDAAVFHMEDGRVLDIDMSWDERERGGDPCKLRRREDENGKLLRRVVCEAVAQSIFQVVLTPHHDRAHQNHIHLELVPNVEWSYVH
jgi:hypothetical protein